MLLILVNTIRTAFLIRITIIVGPGWTLRRKEFEILLYVEFYADFENLIKKILAPILFEIFDFKLLTEKFPKKILKFYYM